MSEPVWWYTIQAEGYHRHYASNYFLALRVAENLVKRYQAKPYILDYEDDYPFFIQNEDTSAQPEKTVSLSFIGMTSVTKSLPLKDFVVTWEASCTKNRYDFINESYELENNQKKYEDFYKLHFGRNILCLTINQMQELLKGMKSLI